VIDFAAISEKAQIVFDSTFSNPDHARRLVHRALDAGKAISIVYVNRRLGDAFKGMLERAESQGRAVTIAAVDRLAAGRRRARGWN
jgi:zeta toxin